MKNATKIGFVFWFVLALSACDHGLEPPPAAKPGFGGRITYKGKWPPADSLVRLALVAFKHYPPTNILNDVLNGDAVYDTSLTRNVGFQDYQFFTEPVTFEYVVVAQQYGPDIFSNWRVIGVYSEDPIAGYSKGCERFTRHLCLWHRHHSRFRSPSTSGLGKACLAMKVRYTLLSVVILGSSSFLSPQAVLSQGFGAISGTVASSEDNSPLVAANIVLQHTILGATSDSRGLFVISSVPEGKYNLLISRVGFERKLLSNIVVKANDTSEVNITLAPLPIQSEAVVVTASKRDQSLEEIPVSVSLVDSKAIEERNSITINDALRYVPGVNMVQSQVNIRGMSGYSRGIGSRVLLLLDGLPLLTGDTGEINWETIPTLQVDRVEVVKGSGSALYGSSALGGVINVITRDVKEGSEARVRAYTGAYDTPYYNEWKWSDKTRFLEGVSGSFSTRTGPLAILLSGGRANDDGYRQNDSYHRWNAYGKLTYDFSAYETATLSLNLLQQKRGSFFWWQRSRTCTSA